VESVYSSLGFETGSKGWYCETDFMAVGERQVAIAVRENSKLILYLLAHLPLIPKDNNGEKGTEFRIDQRLCEEA